MVLLLDNFDSFTYNLQDYLYQVGVRCSVVRNDVPTEKIFKHVYKGIVLSPGPGRPAAAGCMMEVLAHYEKSHPILGICLGHQAIGEYFGAKLEKASLPMHGKISEVFHSGNGLFTGLSDKLQVVRYHSLALKNVPEGMTVSAQTAAGEVMAISHQFLPIHGLQFHPEAVLTQNGLQMLHNWATFYKLSD